MKQSQQGEFNPPPDTHTLTLELDPVYLPGDAEPFLMFKGHIETYRIKCESKDRSSVD